MSTVDPMRDPFGLADYVAERFGLDPNEVASIDAHVGLDAPTVTVTLYAIGKPEQRKYATGGVLKPGWHIVGERGPELDRPV